MNSCPVCGARRTLAFSAKVLAKHEVDYWRCGKCGLLQTVEPWWLEESYADAITASDTGLLSRNLAMAAPLAALLYLRFDPRAAFCDLAGGFGLLTRLMRDQGFDYFWEDPYCRNLMAVGFEADRCHRPFEALTAFEVIEHVHNPLGFIDDAMRRHRCRNLIFSTVLYEGAVAPSVDWWYYSFHSGQHITFYQRETLASIGRRLGLQFASVHGIHILSERRIDIPLPLRLATGRLSRVCAWWAARELGSRTQADSAALADRAGGAGPGSGA